MKRNVQTHEVELAAGTVRVEHRAQLPEVAQWAGVDAQKRALIRLPNDGVMPARVVGSLRTEQLRVGAEVLVMFAGGRRYQPIVVDTVVEHVANGPISIGSSEGVELRCGDASIALKPNGHVVVRGQRVETDAEGTNRIKGGSVRIN